MSRLQPGERAPTFTVTTLDGAVLELGAVLEKGPLWLAFYRFAACPLCNIRVHQEVGEWPRFAKYRFTKIAIFQSPASRLEAWVAPPGPPFVLVPDPDMNLYREWAVEASLAAFVSRDVVRVGTEAIRQRRKLLTPHDGPAGRIPADFLVTTDGRISVARYGTSIADHMPFEDAEAFLRTHAESDEPSS